jgi:hypothetical protein
MNDRVPQAVLEAAARRAHRAAVARTLEGGLDWAAFDQAPPWLALDGASLRMLQRRVGSVLLAPALRLWIAAAKVKAAREAVGHAWWWRLLDHRPWPDWSSEVAQWGDWPTEAATSADAVAEVLDDAGAAVLLATLPHGALRHAASQALGSSATAPPLVMPQAQAQAVLGLTLRLLQDEAFAVQAQAEESGGTRDDATGEDAGDRAGEGAGDHAGGNAGDRADDQASGHAGEDSGDDAGHAAVATANAAATTSAHEASR